MNASPIRVPVLMYHEIGRPPETKSRLAVSQAAFAEQLAYLHSSGFNTITAGTLSAILSAETQKLPNRTVVLTFDDGYENFYSRAMPLLRQYNFSATLFVTTGWVQDNGRQSAENSPGQMLSWSQITDAALAGMEIAAHSHRHPQLDQLPENLLNEELYASKELLEDKVGYPVTGLAYPFGYSNARVRQLARDAGYRYGCTVQNVAVNPASDLFALPRLTVRNSTTIRAFHQLIHDPAPMVLLNDRMLTKGWAVVRRSRALLNIASRRVSAYKVDV